MFRYGGDEFIALLPECNEQGARDVASRFKESLPDSLSCSIGIAVSVEDETPNALIERGDVAMYRAKQQGRGQFVVWDPSIDVPMLILERPKELELYETDILVEEY